METYYYNYYNVKHRYTPATPQTPGWKKDYTITTDEIKSNNNSQDSDAYKAYCKLEDTYYNVSVSNRSKYKTERELYAALNQKYSAYGAYSQYSSVERNAMYENELNMTLFGCLGGGGNVDDPTDSKKQSYNRQMVNLQLNTLLSSSGIDLNQLSKYNITFTIDPMNFILKVYGVDDEELAANIERVLNTGNNAQQLFHHVLNSSRPSISDDVLTKYRAMKEFQRITGLDLSEFTHTKNNFLNIYGQNALDVYEEALNTSNQVPSGYKGAAYEYFESLLNKLSAKSYKQIQDLNLSINYQNGSLYDVSDSYIQTSKFDVSV